MALLSISPVTVIALALLKASSYDIPSSSTKSVAVLSLIIFTYLAIAVAVVG